MPSERLREAQTHRYYQPWLDLQQFASIDPRRDRESPFNLDLNGTAARASQDKALTAFAQLATLRLNVKRAMISLIDSTTQYILAEATKSLSLVSSTRHKEDDGIWLGSAIMPRDSAVCQHTFEDTYTVNDENGNTVMKNALVVPDMREDARFKDRDYVINEQVMFYAGVPIKTRSGVRIGVYAVSSDKPRAPLDYDELLFMEDVAAAVFEHLELAKARFASVKGERMVTGLTSFVEGKYTIAGPDETEGIESMREQPSDTDKSNASSGTDDTPPKKKKTAPAGSNMITDLKHLFNRAARIIRESTPADGVLFLDASKGSIGSKVNGSTATNPTTSDGNRDNGDEAMNYTSEHYSMSSSEGETTQSDSEFPSLRQSMSNIMGLSLGEASPSAERLRSADFSFSLKDLEHCIEAYPRGKIFGLPGYDSSSSGDEKHASRGTFTPTEKPGNTKVSASRRKARRGTLVQQIFKNFPEVRNIVFLPMWDFSQDKWMAGMLLWTCQMGRLMDAEDELPYLKAFANSLIVEACRITAQHEVRAKTTFIASVSHELRSPLHGILGSVEFLHDTPLNSFQNGLLGSVETCGKTLLDTIDHVLDHAKINNFSGKTARKTSRNRVQSPSKPNSNLTSEFDVSALLEDVVDSIFLGRTYRKTHQIIASVHDGTLNLPEHSLGQPQTPASAGHKTAENVAVILSISKQDNWQVLSQPGAMRRVVMNLLGNALKYTNAGFVEVALCINGEKQQELSRLSLDIKVTDTGIGISEEYLENKLFQPFSQENPFTEGTGLGLSIVRQIVDSLKGKIKVKSQQNLGTEITISLGLPVAQQSSVTAHDLASIAAQTKGLKLCIVERLRQDSIHSQETLIRMQAALCAICEQWFGMNVYQKTNDAPDAAEYYRSVDPDFFLVIEPVPLEIIVNYINSMPWPLKNGRLVPLLIICSNAYEATILEKTFAEGKGFTGFVTVLSQPCGPRKLAKIFDELINQRDKTDTPQSQSAVELPAHSSNIVERPKLKEFPPISEVVAPQIVVTGPAPPLYAGGRPEIPAVELPAAFSPPPTESANPIETAYSTYVLIVDDNIINQQLLVAFMKNAKFRYACASNGLEALEAYKAAQGAFDFVLMDISMPVMDGLMSTRKIREWEVEQKAKKTNIIALTGLASSSAREEAFSSGVDRFLVKPVKFKELKTFLAV